MPENKRRQAGEMGHKSRKPAAVREVVCYQYDAASRGSYRDVGDERDATPIWTSHCEYDDDGRLISEQTAPFTAADAKAATGALVQAQGAQKTEAHRKEGAKDLQGGTVNGSGEAIGLQAADLGPAVFSAAPVDPRLWHARGIELCRGGQFREGVEALRQSVQLAPQSPQMRNNLAGVLGTLGKHTEAETELREAVRLKPDYAEAWGNLGVALEHLDRYEEAIDAMRQALALEPNRWFLHAHLSNACRKAGRPEEAVDAARKAAALNANAAEAHNSLGAALAELCDVPAAIEAYRRAVALRPDYPDAHHNLGTALLLSGEFEQAWAEYEWRRRLPNPVFRRAGRAWDGLDPSGQTLLIYGEGGLGNVIQFARYIPLLAEQGARVIVECQPELVQLMARLDGTWKVIPCGQAPPAYDVYFPLASLPFMWGTTLQTIPAKVPYLSVDAALSAKWGEVVRRVPGFRVGVCWKGSQRIVHLRGRSFPPAALGPLAAVPGISLISLQHGERPPGDVPIHTLPGLDPMTMRLEDAAAVIANLDLVISCDTSIAHLAGAVGIPVWVALKFAACWRWMLNREDSPWYPTMRLFRQEKPGEWRGTFQQMREQAITAYSSFTARSPFGPRSTNSNPRPAQGTG